MDHRFSVNSRRSEFRTRGEVRTSVKCCLLGIVFIAACEEPVANTDRTLDQRPVTQAAPWRINVVPAASDGGMALSWIPFPGNITYNVRWRAGNSVNWREQGLGVQSNVFIPQLRMGVTYTFVVSAMLGTRIISADTLEETARNRGDCAYSNYTEAQTFFCSRVSADEYMRSQGVAPEQLRCRNRAVTNWGPDAPDCLYTAENNFHMLLLRNADSTFHPSATPPSVQDTRAMLRAAIWPAGDPFGVRDFVRPTELPERLDGSITRYITARTFLFDGGELAKSRVTRFIPPNPIPGRYAIFHEGHGGSGTVIASEMIHHLLDTGWEVYSMDMLLYGNNEVDRNDVYYDHFDVPKSDDGNTSIVAVHMMAIKRLVDFIESSRPPASTLLLMGRSGGGLMSYMYGALDPRISAVISVAGGRPMSQRLNSVYGPYEIGDPEQSAPEIFSGIRHEDLMASAGSRGSLMVWNVYDPCCFPVPANDPVHEYLAQRGAQTGRIVRGFTDTQYILHGLGPAGFSAMDRFVQDVVK